MIRQLLFLGCFGLAGLVGGASLADSPEPIASELRFERVEPDLWRAGFCFDTPVEAISFARPIKGMRASHWQSATEGLALMHEEFASQLVAENGEPFRCGAVDMRTYTRMPPKNYYAFSPFSGGGMSAYTGYLTGQVKVDGAWQDYEPRAEYKGLPGEQVIGRDLTALGHQFIYFGTEPVQRSEGAVTIIDPAVPDGARDMILAAIPQVNAELKNLFGRGPQEPYLVFMAAGELDAFNGASQKAGTQKNQILFTLKGRDVIGFAEAHPDFYAKWTAHEVIHLWQGDTWATLGHDYPWVHEGSADAVAYELMRRIGQYSPERYQEVWSRVWARCAERLKTSSIHGGPANGNFDIVYQCGAVVNWLAGALINPADPGAGILAFWRAMAGSTDPGEAALESEELYFHVLTKLGVGHDHVSRLRAFLDETPEDGVEALRELAQDLGLPATAMPQSGR